MLRNLAILALVAGLSGCSTENEEKAMLVQYINKMTKLADKNKQIVDSIKHLRKPIDQISAQDLVEARELINSYVSDVQTMFPRDVSYRELRVTHNLYVDKVSQAVELSGDKGREMKREKNLEARAKELKQKAKKEAAAKKEQSTEEAHDANADMPEVEKAFFEQVGLSADGEAGDAPEDEEEGGEEEA